jgi:hypothetical protein
MSVRSNSSFKGAEFIRASFLVRAKRSAARSVSEFSEVRATPFALCFGSRKTEYGAILFLTFNERAAPFGSV